MSIAKFAGGVKYLVDAKKLPTDFTPKNKEHMSVLINFFRLNKSLKEDKLLINLRFNYFVKRTRCVADSAAGEPEEEASIEVDRNSTETVKSFQVEAEPVDEEVVFASLDNYHHEEVLNDN